MRFSSSATAVTGSPGGAAESPGRFACSEWPAPPLQRVYGSHWRWTGVARRPQRCRNISCSGQCSTVAKRRRGLGGRKGAPAGTPPSDPSDCPGRLRSAESNPHRRRRRAYVFRRSSSCSSRRHPPALCIAEPSSTAPSTTASGPRRPHDNGRRRRARPAAGRRRRREASRGPSPPASPPGARRRRLLDVVDIVALADTQGAAHGAGRGERHPPVAARPAHQHALLQHLHRLVLHQLQHPRHHLWHAGPGRLWPEPARLVARHSLLLPAVDAGAGGPGRAGAQDGHAPDDSGAV
ncbi:hypothetical protein VFPBJ_09687 [Purpureocillium lilacinum]|uniref:Uncharacterized protein n=1 Tax=Purpureocillium lilacinum TaxID=33203 RepID=A0A179GD15_PURLI|nr:hypothetical protein VFPBJ_09687 [Purpureocillium lilacinum]